MLPIKGVQKLSLIDYPPYMVATVFLANCDFRCPYCQNPDLIKNPDKLPTITEEELIEFLKSRKKWLDGICITGGEPCIHKELPELIKRIKELGFKIKLDTNGSKPEMIKVLINEQLIDYIAMDIKAPLDNYEEVTQVKVDKEKIKESVDFIISSGIDYEFRLTCVPTLHKEEDFVKIGEWLKDCKRFFIQQFSPKICLNKEFENIKPFTEVRLKKFKEILENYINKVEIRGI